MLVARRSEELARIVAELNSGDIKAAESAGTTGEADFLAGDICDPAVRAGILRRCVERFGGIDFLVNNAGVGALGRFADAGADRLRQIMEVNFFAPAELIREALPLLERGRRPIVVNVGSILAHRAIPHASEYCASKFALRGLGESLRAELTPRGIDLLNVHPGTTDTDFFEHAIERGKYPWSQPRGASPQAVARKFISAMRRGRHEAIFGLPAKLMHWADKLAPGIVDRVLRDTADGAMPPEVAPPTQPFSLREKVWRTDG